LARLTNKEDFHCDILILRVKAINCFVIQENVFDIKMYVSVSLSCGTCEM
jgi:hypothetical protein